jgi:hypothetical protein
MRKLRLQIEELKVETFEAGGGGGQSTVRGRQASDLLDPCDPVPVEDSINYCSPPPTAAFSCGYTCGNTCSCGCTYTQPPRWTCDLYMSECTSVPVEG